MPTWVFVLLLVATVLGGALWLVFIALVVAARREDRAFRAAPPTSAPTLRAVGGSGEDGR